ncbi:MAG: DUF4342 domain-containing protein [Clostridiales bacterium]|nr:DUF4342 domain-containing protein [Clostridiales bacterium]
MENYQKIEQIVNKSGCSYEEAKAALEGCGWDMIDAIISLEREGKVKKEAAEQAAETAEAVMEETAEAAAEAEAAETSQQIIFSCEDGGTGREEETYSKDAEEGTRKKFKLWSRIKSILTKNRMVIIRKNGQVMINLPIFVPVIALICFFWTTLILAVIAMVFGCHFHFEGEDLGKASINNTMDKATDYAEKVREDLTRKRK